MNKLEEYGLEQYRRTTVAFGPSVQVHSYTQDTPAPIIEALEIAIEALEHAPHQPGCGNNGYFTSGDPVKCRPSTCNCFKAVALQKIKNLGGEK